MAAFPADLPICDPHFHCWDNKSFYNKNLGGIADGPLGVYMPADYLKDASSGSLPIRSAVHVETVVGQTEGGFKIDTVAESTFLRERVIPGFAAGATPVNVVAFVDLGKDDAEATILRHKEELGAAFVGIRMILNYHPTVPSLTWPQVGRGDYLTGGCATFSQNFALLAAHGLSFDLHANWFQLGDAAKFLEAHRDTVVVVDHTGVPKLATGDAVEDAERIAEWKRGMASLAALPNVYVKLSGLEYIYPRWLPCLAASGEQDAVAWHTVRSMVHWCISTFGPQRCMFASNFPVDLAMGDKGLPSLYAGFLEIARSHPAIAADASGALLRGLFAGVAEKVYKLAKQ